MSANPATWMTNHYDALKDRPFSAITLFGSHDSGMSTTQSAGLGSIAGSAGMTQAQSLSIRDQIVLGGVRYLDLRPVAFNNEDYYLAHYDCPGNGDAYVGWLGVRLADAVQQIAQAYTDLTKASASVEGGSKEVLLIELGHGRYLMDNAESSALMENQPGDIAGAFTSVLGPHLYTNSSTPSFWDLTPSDLVSANQRIFLNAGADTAPTSFTGPVFPHSAAHYTGLDNGGADNYGGAINALTSSLLDPKNTDPLLLPYHCTGNAGKEYVTLQDMAADMNPLFMDSLATWCSKGAIRFDPSNRRVPVIVDVDYVSKDDLSLLDACIGLNLGQYEGIVNFPTPTPIGQGCTQGPALASLNGVTYVAWSGTDSHLNLLSSADGTTFGNKYTSQVQKTEQSPALCVDADPLAIGWSGTDGKGRPNFSQVDVNGQTITDIAKPVTLPEESAHAPAMATLNKVRYAAWTGTDDSHSLNFMWSTDGGKTWPAGNKYVSSESSSDSPALCVLGTDLYVVWKGKDNQLNVMPLTLNESAVAGHGIKSQPGQSSAHGPAAVTVGKTMYIAWVGYGHNELNLIGTADGRTFGDKYVSRQSSSATPALCTDGQNLCYAWSGTDQMLNVARFLLPGQS